MKTISPTAAADNPPLPEKPVLLLDHGVDPDEEHDIDTAAGDEGIDDEEMGEYTDPSAVD